MSHRGPHDELGQQDAEARALAQREFRVPLALEAGAGTGKTGILTARIISWCLQAGWEKAQKELSGACRLGSPHGSLDPERIAARVLGGVAAITFTEAASAEMASRIAGALSELESGKLPLGVDPLALPQKEHLCRKRARALLGSLDHLVVQTIHAFCLRLLSRFPLEAGLHPQLMVDAEGLLLEEMAREVVEPLLASAQDQSPEPDLLALLQAGVRPQEILEALLALVQEAAPLEALSEDPFHPSRLAGLRDTLERSLENFFVAGGSTLQRVGKRSPKTLCVLEAMERTREVLHLLRLGTLEALQQACEQIQDIWTEELLERLSEWASGRFNNSERKILGEAQGALLGPARLLHRWMRHLCRMRPLLFLKARGVLATLLERMYREMRSRGIVSFGGILRGARDLLRDHPEVLAQVRRSIDQLLVDEFQDTDLLQCEIIRMIALEGPLEQRPGLFIVGDPKQSIYGWRNADLRAYDRFLEELIGQGGKRLILSVNFRSAPAILQEVERALEQVMIREPGVQPAFQPLLPCPEREGAPGFSLKPWAPVEYWVSRELGPSQNGKPRRTGRTQATELEARALAHDILRLHREANVGWSEIGVLVRSTGDLEIYLEALKEAGIPYWVSSDRSYFRRREILEATALVCSVLDPTDQVALVSFLRSASVGVPDAAWIQLWSRGFPRAMAELSEPDPKKILQIRELVEEVAQGLPCSIPGLSRIEGWQWSLLAAVETLARLRKAFREGPQDLFLERMRELTMLEATEAARYLGAFRLANLERFFRWLLSALEAASGGPHVVLRLLRSAIRRQREAQEATPPEAVEEAVQVMTIHKAKGLDFSHVYVLQAHKGTRTSRDQATHVERLESAWECSLLGWPSLGYLEVEERAQAISRAETIRTLYVAMTRAKDRLVMAGNWEGASANEDTYASVLRKRRGGLLELDPAMARVSGGQDAGDLVDQFGVSWRFPALWAPRPERMEGEGTCPEVPPPEEMATQAQQLSSLSSWAESRKARPWQAPMSEEANLALEDSWSQSPGRLAQEPESTGREVALLVGRIIHRALELMDLGVDPAKELGRLRGWLQQQVHRSLSGEEATLALARILGIWDGLMGGRILRRLKEIKEHVVARELPVLLAPSEDSGPVGLWAGSIDLLYRGPEDGRWVVVDYKTDQLASQEEMARLCCIYASQGARYVRAVKEMMGLEEPPRFELWFLHADRIQEVEIEA